MKLTVDQNILQLFIWLMQCQQFESVNIIMNLVLEYTKIIYKSVWVKQPDTRHILFNAYCLVYLGLQIYVDNTANIELLL